MFARALPLAAAGLLLSATAGATIMLPLSIDDMTKEANAIVRARVVDRTANWDAKHERIYTTTTLEVIESIHATMSVPARVQVRALGGEVGDVGMKVAGTPQFAVGEEVVVFLRADEAKPGAFQVIGMSQGKYQIQKAEDGRVLAVPNVDGIAFAQRGNDGVLRAGLRDATAPSPLTFAELRQKIVSAAHKVKPARK